MNIAKREVQPTPQCRQWRGVAAPWDDSSMGGDGSMRGDDLRGELREELPRGAPGGSPGEGCCFGFLVFLDFLFFLFFLVF